MSDAPTVTAESWRATPVEATSYDAIESMFWQTLAPVLPDALAFSSHTPVVVMGVARAGDPEATQTVYTTIIVLAVLGVVLAALAVWVLRRTRPEPELLAPLETMQTRRWRKLDPAAQRRLLDEARPDDAAPLRREASAPAVDSSFATVAPVASFDDLSEDDGAEDDGAEDDGAEGEGAEGEEHDGVGDGDDRDADTQHGEHQPASRVGDDTGEIPDGDELDIVVVIEDDTEDDTDDDDDDDDDDNADHVDDAEADGEDQSDDTPVGRSIDPLLMPKPASPTGSI